MHPQGGSNLKLSHTLRTSCSVLLYTYHYCCWTFEWTLPCNIPPCCCTEVVTHHNTYSSFWASNTEKMAQSSEKTECTGELHMSNNFCYSYLLLYVDSLFSPYSHMPFTRKSCLVYILLQMHHLLTIIRRDIIQKTFTSVWFAVKKNFEANTHEFSSFLSDGNTHKSG